MRRYRLTPEVEKLIVASIRAGAYPQVAAETAGIPWAVCRDWLHRGEHAGRAPYGSFWSNVLQAKAQARLGAELHVRNTDPKFWLRYGPGHAGPCWSSARPARRRAGDADPLFAHLVPNLLDKLAANPEARAAFVAALEASEKSPTRAKRQPWSHFYGPLEN